MNRKRPSDWRILPNEETKRKEREEENKKRKRRVFPAILTSLHLGGVTSACGGIDVSLCLYHHLRGRCMYVY